MSEVSDFIKLSADEEVIREYKGFKMLKPQSATLTIAVTSKRLILYAMTRKAMKMNRGTSVIVTDMHVDVIEYARHRFDTSENTEKKD